MPWVIRVEDAAHDSHTFALQEKDGCFVSPHTKLAGITAAAALSSRRLAEQFLEAIYPVMRKRHGSDTVLTVEEVAGSEWHCSDQIVIARMRQNNFASNKAPVLKTESEVA